MKTMGIMQKVRELLKQGLSSGEIIQKGFAPGTVYRVQREMRNIAHLAQMKDSDTQRMTTNTASEPEVHRQESLRQKCKQLEETIQYLQTENDKLNGIEEMYTTAQSENTKLVVKLKTCIEDRDNILKLYSILKNQNIQLKQREIKVYTENRTLKQYLDVHHFGWRCLYPKFKVLP